MTSWDDAAHAAPELADLVRGRIDDTGLAFLATLRADGSPRISGVEPWFADGHLWMGMMWHSRKALDLIRDGRCALHSASVDKEVRDGDARISGVAIEHTTDADIASGRAAFEAHSGYPPPEGPMHLFHIDVTELVFVRPEGDQLAIRSWTPDGGERRIERT